MNLTKLIISAGLFIIITSIAMILLQLSWRKTVIPTPPVNTSINNETALQTQSNSDGSVEVSVTPLNLDRTAEVWTFSVSLNTHSIELDDDLAKQSFLRMDKGKEATALGWEGDPAGGHHREGKLIFKKPPTELKMATLLIKDVAGISERLFVWTLP